MEQFDTSERDFLDEIYESARKVEPAKRSEPLGITFRFPEVDEFKREREHIRRNDPHAEKTLFDENGRYKDEWQRPPRMRAYEAQAVRFGRIGALQFSSLLVDGVHTGEDRFTISVVPSDFLGFYNRKYGVQAEEKHGAPSSTGNSHLIFLLSADGDLQRQTPIPGDMPYALEKDSRRHRVLKVIVSCKTSGYCETRDLADSAGCKPIEFRRTCGELRSQICKHFSGVRRMDIIDGKTGSGYRINLIATIIETP